MGGRAEDGGEGRQETGTAPRDGELVKTEGRPRQRQEAGEAAESGARTTSASILAQSSWAAARDVLAATPPVPSATAVLRDLVRRSQPESGELVWRGRTIC